MVVQVPLTLSNWEFFEELGYEIRRFFPNHYKGITHIRVLTNSKAIRAGIPSLNYVTCTALEAHTLHFLGNGEDSEASMAYHRMLKEQANDFICNS